MLSCMAKRLADDSGHRAVVVQMGGQTSIWGPARISNMSGSCNVVLLSLYLPRRYGFKGVFLVVCSAVT